MIGRRSPLVRLLTIEIPILAIIAFAIGPYLWMVLTSIRPDADLTQFPAALRAERAHA